jgi:hypothetical protein
MYISYPVIVTILVLFSFNSHAGEPVSDSYGSKWLVIEHQDGLTSLLPATTPLELLRQVQTCRNKKLVRQIELDKSLKTSQFGIKDALITAIMPGGLVYATFRNMEHKQVESQLENLMNELSQLNRDLDMLKLAVGERTLSMLYQP